MNIEIRLATYDDAEAKGRVHFESWNETYQGLMPVEYLKMRKVENSIKLAKRYPENTLLLLVDGEVVGFSCYLLVPPKSVSIQNSGFINALYILKKYHSLGLGKKLLDETIALLNKEIITLYVMKENKKAISFYEHYGFKKNNNSIKETINYGEISFQIIEDEMVYYRKNLYSK